MTTPIVTTTLQPIRTIAGGGGVFPNDPAVSTPDLAALPAWAMAGKTMLVAVYVAAFDAAGARVPGVTATVGGYFFHRPESFGLADNKPEAWFDADTRSAVNLDKPLVFDVSDIPKMGVRISNVVDASGLATELRISVQEMPRGMVVR